MKDIVYILAIFISILTFSSCSSEDDEAQKKAEVTKIVENRDAKDLLNDLYIGCDGDVQALCRILNATPSVVDRIRNGQTNATTKFEERIREVTVYYTVKGQSFSKLQSVLDSEYSWYDYVLDNPLWFLRAIVIGLVAILILLFVIHKLYMGNYDTDSSENLVWWIIKAIVIITIVAWLAIAILSWCKSPKDIEDNYTNSINPVFEQII